jgi:hypothetical protein
MARADLDMLRESVALYQRLGNNKIRAAAELGITRASFQSRMRRAAKHGLLGTQPVLDGFELRSISTQRGPNGELQREWIKQTPEPGESFTLPEGHVVKGVSALTNADGQIVQQWTKTGLDATAQAVAMRAVADALKEEIPREAPTPAPRQGRVDLLNCFVATDVHLGCLAWSEETGSEDYDLKIAEKLLMDWFSAAIAQSPPADTAVFAQLGDFLHHDAHESVTPAHRHVLDADSRLQKIIRVAIRCLRRIIAMLLEKHSRVHVIMADANHDPAGGAWLREMFAAFYEDELRITVDSSASTYYVYQFGQVSLFFHHGHKRKISDVDSVFAGRFREIYGSTKYSYAHLGHLHSDELRSSNLMKVERHETLAAPDAYAANGGWLSKRSAKVITYHQSHGEVGRITLTPGMVTKEPA